MTDKPNDDKSDQKKEDVAKEVRKRKISNIKGGLRKWQK